MKYFALLYLAIVSISCTEVVNDNKDLDEPTKIIYPLNKDEIRKGKESLAIVGATLIDGNGGSPIPNSLVIIKENIIEFVGTSSDRSVPEGMEVFDASGLTLLPGLIDAHYHNGYNTKMPVEYLKRGITSVRDPGAWMDFYDSVRNTKKDIPRLFLTGPHIDTYPPAYPGNSFLIKDALEGELVVHQFAKQGATAIKVYFGLSIGMIRSICEAAHANGIPVTGHLEIANAMDAIKVGMDGVEHITSFGTVLLPMREAEKYKQMIESDNEARERGRYEAWNSLDLDKK